MESCENQSPSENMPITCTDWMRSVSEETGVPFAIVCKDFMSKVNAIAMMTGASHDIVRSRLLALRNESMERRD